ncbi:hypothetical protein F511_15152 [Dorcoceras hygrometricum]|uniref:Uncharacterized protein n=1 Tax=Dorcoceras hygrometricum TaxID=472368 RepID=A0A2Z7DED6_9LAMI|nr:hypothetical protein F511_15152 [Dorcoceras hygrometricum]
MAILQIPLLILPCTSMQMTYLRKMTQLLTSLSFLPLPQISLLLLLLFRNLSPKLLLIKRDILGNDAALDQSLFPSSTADISASLAALRESFSKIVANQTRYSRKSGDAHSEVMCKINHVERVFLDSLAAQNEAFQAAAQKEVKDLQAALSKDFDDKLADIHNDLLEFRVETQEQLASLGAHLAELIDFITKGSDDKKGEGSSSHPQPPPDDQNRPSGGSGSRADDLGRYGGGTVSREGDNRGGDGRRRGDNSGSSKRRRSDSGGGSGGRINYGPYLSPKRDDEYWISGKR